MVRKFTANWNYLGWTETPELLKRFEFFTNQETWDNNLLRVMDNLVRMMNYDNDGVKLDSIGIHPYLYEKFIKNLTMHRFIKSVKLLGNYTIFIDEKYPINEIMIYSYDSPEKNYGVLRIQNLIENKVYKINPDTTINENNIAEYLEKIQNRFKNTNKT